ncbi:hypothetical protein EDC04DRAFT_3093399 [Pisolithus marmoratus]|nr:hypothetical protein EDC04DRAFT_3093399 [Pisolithus marmoratus]
MGCRNVCGMIGLAEKKEKNPPASVARGESVLLYSKERRFQAYLALCRSMQQLTISQYELSQNQGGNKDSLQDRKKTKDGVERKTNDNRPENIEKEEARTNTNISQKKRVESNVHMRDNRETEVQEREKMTWSFHLPHPLLPALPLGLDDALHDLSRSLSSLSRSADGNGRGRAFVLTEDGPGPEPGRGGGGGWGRREDEGRRAISW